MFQIILNDETLETDFGELTKGDVLETVVNTEVSDIKRYINEKYFVEGINVSWRRIKWLTKNS